MSFAGGLQLHHVSQDQSVNVETSFNLHSGLKVFSRTTVMIICFRTRHCLQAQFFHIYEVILHTIVRTMPSLHVDQMCGFCSDRVHLHGCRHFNNHLWIPCPTSCSWFVACIGSVGMRQWSDVSTTGCSDDNMKPLRIFFVNMPHQWRSNFHRILGMYNP